jgi:RNA polymerase sigma-70 factor (ECF subfamily)
MEIDPDEWRRHRPYLLAVAYRLLGSMTEAEDAVQEASLRLQRPEVTGVTDVRGWLTTVTSRICLDQLRSARVRRESYVGQWLPEPVLGAAAVEPVGPAPEPDPADRVTMAESVRMALLVVLENLTPAERTAFVLHDVFGLGFAEIAAVVGRTEAGCRQLASRARRHVRENAPRFDVDRDELIEIVSAFVAAAAQGDLAGLVNVLDPDVVLRSDGGGVIPAARRPVRGAESVAKLLGHGLVRLYTGTEVFLTEVNGSPGVLMYRDGAVLGVASVVVAGGRITEIDLVVNPEKLRRVPPRGPDTPGWTLP